MIFGIISTIIVAIMLFAINLISAILISAQVLNFWAVVVLFSIDFLVGFGLGIGWGAMIAEKYYEED